MAEPGASLPPIEQARRYAALSGPFDPVEALPETLVRKPRQAAVVASQLAWVCDTHPLGAPDKWLLRTPERRDVLRALADAEALRESVAERRARSVDSQTRDLLEAIMGEEAFDPDAVGREIASPSSNKQLERIIVALDRAGDVAPAYALLPGARSALAGLQRDTRWRRLQEQGVFGREIERKSIDAWLTQPIEKPPVRALYVRGMPGIGKSVLLDDSVRAIYDTLDPIIVRLDFDRAGLDVQDVVGLTMEVARQVADQIGSEGPALQSERLVTASVDARPNEKSTTSLRSQLPQQLAAAIGAAVQKSGRPALVMLDTLEVLRNRGETHPESLFRWLDQLVTSGLRPLRVLAAGRGGALDAQPQRIGEPIELDGLPDPAADAMLETLGVPTRDRDEIRALTDGNPLLLRLAGELVRQAGAGALRRRRSRELAASFLYRFLVSRIDDPALKQIVHPGLVARRISAELIDEVLAPQLGLGRIGAKTAKRLWEDLEKQSWLVEPDPGAPGFLRHRSDMRAVLLPLIYRDLPARAARIDAEAMHWFARRPEPWAQVEAGYHQLQLMRRRPTPPPLIGREIAFQIDEEMLADLPPVARDLVHVTRGERSTQFRAASPEAAAADDSGLARELTGIIERQDWIEGEHIIRDVVDRAGVAAQSQAADAIRAFWWRSGRWSRARQMLRERDRLVSGDEDIRKLPSLLGLARLEMRAEFEPRALLDWLRQDDRNGSLAGEMSIGSLDDAGRMGALGFVLEAIGAGQFRNGRPEESDPVRTTITYWCADDKDPAILRALGDAHERMQARGAGAEQGPATDPAGFARLLAVFNPYAALALNLSVGRDNEWIAAEAKASDDWLIRDNALLPWDATATPATGRDHPISGIARLGLFAEWAQASAYLRGDADLRLIGRSAEAWRRTAAGQWRYGRPPHGWTGPEPVDATMRDRLQALARSRDPRHAAMFQLGLWSAHPDGSGENVWRRLRKRLRGVAAALPKNSKDALEDCARLLLKRRMPSAFVPAAAVLILSGDG